MVLGPVRAVGVADLGDGAPAWAVTDAAVDADAVVAVDAVDGVMAVVAVAGAVTVDAVDAVDAVVTVTGAVTVEGAVVHAAADVDSDRAADVGVGVDAHDVDVVSETGGAGVDMLLVTGKE